MAQLAPQPKKEDGIQIENMIMADYTEDVIQLKISHQCTFVWR